MTGSAEHDGVRYFIQIPLGVMAKLLGLSVDCVVYSHGLLRVSPFPTGLVGFLGEFPMGEFTFHCPWDDSSGLGLNLTYAEMSRVEAVSLWVRIPAHCRTDHIGLVGLQLKTGGWVILGW